MTRRRRLYSDKIASKLRNDTSFIEGELNGIKYDTKYKDRGNRLERVSLPRVNFIRKGLSL